MSSLYLHIPFCTRKCPYCDFFSVAAAPRQLRQYVDLLCLDISLLGNRKENRAPLETIYFGGGTPSLLNAEQVERILKCLDRQIGISPGAEITLEANPGTITARRLEGYLRAGINRLSLGVQSFNQSHLEKLGRVHNREQALNSIGMARRAGCDNLSLDLMFALPGQTAAQLQADLNELLSLHPEHISIYGLTFEAGTPYAKRLQAGKIQPCPDNLYAEQYRLIDDMLQTAGFEHYEISNFARPEKRCRHNQIYWQRQTCLAVGAGAHAFLDRGWGERRHIPAALEKYEEALTNGLNPTRLLERFDRQGAMKEYAYLALRTKDGIDPHDFEQRFGCPVEKAFAPALEQVKTHLRRNDGSWSFDLDGWLIYDHLISYFL